MRIEAGRTGRYCDGMSRRHFVQVGMAGMGGLGLGDFLRARAAANQGPEPAKKNTSVILLWLDGGPGHMDMYDMKPEAPIEWAGLWKPIPTVVPGYDITELFPKQATITDKFSIVRSLHHDTGDHFTGGHWMLTGRDAGVSGVNNQGKFPFFGSIAGKLCGPRQPGMPPNVAIPYAMSIGLRPGYFGANYVGSAYDPFETVNDANTLNFKVNNLHLPPSLTVNRLGDRRTLLSSFDTIRRTADANGVVDQMDKFDAQAFELVTGSRAQKAFDIDSEDPRSRDRYGRHSWGQSCLLARRLVEAGCTFVTCHFGGWDHHWDLQAGMERYLPMVDDCVHGLFTDLDERGLLDTTLVVLCGEFSRTPKMNDGGNGGPPRSQGTPGRDHWGNSMFCLMGGGGVKGGLLYGSTNRLGEAPQDKPVRPGHIHHTIFHVLGISGDTNFLNHAGRPIPAIDHGEVIRELV